MAKTKIESALAVLVLTPAIRDWLKASDPKAFAQACDALNAESGDAPMLVKVTEARREHCKRTPYGLHACFGDGGCRCQCGPCTARYGSDGIWR